MPDLATHVAAAWLAGRAAGLGGRVSKTAVYLFAAGSALPDLLSRAPHLVLDSPFLQQATRSFHTPASLILTTFAASFLFEEARRGAAFAALVLGALFHCLLDFLQETGPNFGYGWLYPVSGFSPQLGLFAGDETVIALPYVLASALLLELGHRFRLRRRARRS